MKDTKLVEILKCFTPDEFKSFEKFINSPYFSIGRDLSGLFALIKKHYPEFKSEDSIMESVFDKLFAETAYNDKKLKNLTSDLTKLAEQFLVHNSLKSNETEFQRILTNVYREKKSDKLFLGTIRSYENIVSKKLFDSLECFKDEEEIEKYWNEYYIIRNDFDKAIPHMLRYSEYFTVAFMVRYLRRMLDKRIVTNNYNITFEVDLLDDLFECLDFEKFMNLIEMRNYRHTWLIKIYYYALQSVIHPTDEFLYTEFKELFHENVNRFSRTEKHHIYIDFVNYCHIREKFARDTSSEALALYKEMLSQEAYSDSENDYMSLIMYRNIMVLSINLKEYEWFEQFIENYSSKLKPEYRHNMMNLAIAHLRFAKGDFDSALKHIGKVKYDYFIYKVDVKNLMLKIFYELNLFDQAFSLIDSYKHYLTETTDLNKEFRVMYYNFLTTYSKILRAKVNADYNDIDFIIKEVSSSNQIYSPTWLIKKATELKIKTDK